MSMISEQVKELRYKADIYNTVGSVWELNLEEAKRLQAMLRPLSWLRLQSIKRSMKRVYEKFDKIYSVEFCSKEEWKDNLCGDEISCSWGDYNGQGLM